MSNSTSLSRLFVLRSTEYRGTVVYVYCRPCYESPRGQADGVSRHSTHFFLFVCALELEAGSMHFEMRRRRGLRVFVFVVCGGDKTFTRL